MKKVIGVIGAIGAMIPSMLWASDASVSTLVDFSSTAYGYLGIFLFILAYAVVPLENVIHLRKSKPVLLAAGLIWIIVAVAYASVGDTHSAHDAIKRCLLEYAELFLFLLCAMTYINTMEERNVFQSLRSYLMSKGFSLRTIFCITGILAFFISSVADNLTTALLMGAVVMAVGGTNAKFVTLGCINIVLAANAGGAFSPFGDITTLMVWQKGKADFTDFFYLFIPSLVNWFVPAATMFFFVEKGKPNVTDEKVKMKYGALAVIGLFLLTIITSVSFHNFLHLPPAAGMMLGLGYLGFCSFYIKKHEGRVQMYDCILGQRGEESLHPLYTVKNETDDIEKIFHKIEEAAFAINSNHVVIHWNSECEKLTGLKSKEMIGTKKQWQALHTKEQSLMADLVVDGLTHEEIQPNVSNMFEKVPFMDNSYDAAIFSSKLGKWLKITASKIQDTNGKTIGAIQVITDKSSTCEIENFNRFDIMQRIARAEWDTLLFFYGVLLCVGGIAELGYLKLMSHYMYVGLGATTANVMIGFLSAIIDNIPIIFSVLSMNPDMSLGQWLLVTLTAGVGGSILSIGSAAGVALMGTARGLYTFGSHLKWAPVIILGYLASIACHLFINASLM